MSDSSGPKSSYYSADLHAIANRHDIAGNPHRDPDALLRTCLAASEEDPDLAGAKPPYKALRAVAERYDITMTDPENGIIGRVGYQFARDLFDNLELEDVEEAPTP